MKTKEKCAMQSFYIFLSTWKREEDEKRDEGIEKDVRGKSDVRGLR